MKKKRFIEVNTKDCVCCGACEKVCPKNAIFMYKGCFAKVDRTKCVGCGICAKICPTNSLSVKVEEILSEE